MSFMFVGERRSEKAIRLNVTWRDGRLAARTLFLALAHCGVDPDRCHFRNLWHDDGTLDDVTINIANITRVPVIALGRKVSRELSRWAVYHQYMIHPAARGAIRTKKKYLEHVRRTLSEARESARKRQEVEAGVCGHGPGAAPRDRP